MPGDREDVILTLTTAHLVGRRRGRPDRRSRRPDGALVEPRGAAIGLVLTGGYRPRDGGARRDPAADLFATLVPEDTYAVASEVHDLLVKTHPADIGKIEQIKALVAENLDVDRILAVATEAVPARCNVDR